MGQNGKRCKELRPRDTTLTAPRSIVIIIIINLTPQGSCLAQLEQAVPPHYFTCNASVRVLRPLSASAGVALLVFPPIQQSGTHLPG
jgi:hypothetical protein